MAVGETSFDSQKVGGKTQVQEVMNSTAKEACHVSPHPTLLSTFNAIGIFATPSKMVVAKDVRTRPRPPRFGKKKPRRNIPNQTADIYEPSQALRTDSTDLRVFVQPGKDAELIKYYEAGVLTLKDIVHEHPQSHWAKHGANPFEWEDAERVNRHLEEMARIRGREWKALYGGYRGMLAEDLLRGLEDDEKEVVRATENNIGYFRRNQELCSRISSWADDMAQLLVADRDEVYGAEEGGEVAGDELMRRKALSYDAALEHDDLLLTCEGSTYINKAISAVEIWGKEAEPGCSDPDDYDDQGSGDDPVAALIESCSSLRLNDNEGCMKRSGWKQSPVKRTKGWDDEPFLTMQRENGDDGIDWSA
ncbi:MAG: hypothetical protein Q9159_005155 [Coniocarpon cinnabarinum]